VRSSKALLVRGDQSLVDIALALNFSCQANFTRAFRQVTGQTPGQYRRSSTPSVRVRRNKNVASPYARQVAVERIGIDRVIEDVPSSRQALPTEAFTERVRVLRLGEAKDHDVEVIAAHGEGPRRPR
jgi:hypothetical protein